MTQLNAAVRRLAVHPFAVLAPPPGFERIERDGFWLLRNPFPMAQIVSPAGLRPESVAAAVAEARAIAAEHDKSILAWWIAPEDDALAEPLERLGLRHEDTPGFEAVEHAMALLQAPRRADTDGIEVREERSFEEFRDSLLVTLAAFEAPEAMCEEVMASAEQRYAEHRTPGNPSHVYVALLDGRVVGSATGAFADAGVNLFGGAVLPEARGRGVYSALIAARWDAAVARGTPALTIQAGRMSKPIVERFGFEAVDAVRLFVDQLG